MAKGLLFSKEQITQVLELIDFQHLHFCAYNINPKLLMPDEVKLLKKYGVNISDLKHLNLTPTKRAYLLGKLVGILKTSARKLGYNEFLKYIRRAQYKPLTRPQQSMLDILENNTWSFVKKQGDTIKTQIKQMFEERNNQWLLQQTMPEALNKEIREQMTTNAIERRSRKELVSEIGHRTGQWNRDLGRIAETEMQNVYQYGTLATILEDANGKDPLVYKDVWAGACKKCIEFYCTDGIGSEPILYKTSTLINNGTNIGKKQQDWKPVIGTVHPF